MILWPLNPFENIEKKQPLAESQSRSFNDELIFSLSPLKINKTKKKSNEQPPLMWKREPINYIRARKKEENKSIFRSTFLIENDG